MVRDIVEKEITPYAAEMDRNNQSMPGLLEKAADMGLLNVIVQKNMADLDWTALQLPLFMKNWAKAVQVLLPHWLRTPWRLILF